MKLSVILVPIAALSTTLVAAAPMPEPEPEPVGHELVESKQHSMSLLQAKPMMQALMSGDSGNPQTGVEAAAAFLIPAFIAAVDGGFLYMLKHVTGQHNHRREETETLAGES